MKLGEKRLVIIPARAGYGTRGQPPKIGRSATLVFEMEIIALSHDCGAWLAPGRRYAARP